MQWSEHKQVPGDKFGFTGRLRNKHQSWQTKITDSRTEPKDVLQLQVLTNVSNYSYSYFSFIRWARLGSCSMASTWCRIAQDSAPQSLQQ